jgi:mannose/fructose/N-acetylgalactosamine-specific phosphotransferase system component IIC
MLNWKVYVYLISMSIIGIVGAYIQYKYFYESEEDKQKREEAEKHKETGEHADTLLNKH